MKIKLISYTPDAAKLLVFTKRTRLSMTAENFAALDKLTESEILDELAYMADTIPSSWEFVNYVFAIEGVSRAFTHQFVRTRTGSFAQQSMRVTSMDDFDYVIGPSLKDGAAADYHACMAMISEYYDVILEQGGAIEDARGILPTNICTNIVAQFNLRTLSDMVKSRSGGRTQGEYRDVVKLMADAILDVHPWAHLFLFPKGRGYFDELEQFANSGKLGNQDRTKLLKIIDKMRKAQ